MKIISYNSLTSLGDSAQDAIKNLVNEKYTGLSYPEENNGIPESLDNRPFGFVKDDSLKSIPGKLVPQTDRSTKIALVSASNALNDYYEYTGKPTEQGQEIHNVGLVTSTCFGGFSFGQKELHNLYSSGAESVSAYQSFAWFYAVNTGQISILKKLKGAGTSIVADEVGGAYALVAARLMLDNEGMDAVIVGGVDSYMCPLGLASVDHNEIQSLGLDGYQPYNDKNGFSIGEGAAFLVVTNDQHSMIQETGTQTASIKSVKVNQTDPDDHTKVKETFIRNIKDALSEANIKPKDITSIVPNASGLIDMDMIEAEVIEDVFGKSWRSLISVSKIKTGKIGAAGMLNDVVLASESINSGGLLPRYWKDDCLEPQRNDENCLVLGIGNSGQLASIIVGK